LIPPHRRRKAYRVYWASNFAECHRHDRTGGLIENGVTRTKLPQELCNFNQRALANTARGVRLLRGFGDFLCRYLQAKGLVREPPKFADYREQAIAVETSWGI
jgi:hypothetical protein